MLIVTIIIIIIITIIIIIIITISRYQLYAGYLQFMAHNNVISHVKCLVLSD
jgi:hypothetical protein